MKDMETNTAAIYLRKSTADDGKSVAAQISLKKAAIASLTILG